MHIHFAQKAHTTRNLIYDQKQRQPNVLCQFGVKTWLPFAHSFCLAFLLRINRSKAERNEQNETEGMLKYLKATPN